MDMSPSAVDVGVLNLFVCVADCRLALFARDLRESTWGPIARYVDETAAG